MSHDHVSVVRASSPRHTVAHGDVRARHGEGGLLRTDSGLSADNPVSGDRSAAMRPLHALQVDSGLPSAPLSIQTSLLQLPRLTLALLAIDAMLVLLLHRLLSIVGALHGELFYLYYQPFAPTLAMLWFWATAVRYWERHGVRYDVCFASEDQRHLLPSAALFRMAAVLSMVVLGSACTFLLQCVAGNLSAASLQPPLVYGAVLALILIPGPFLHGDTRRFFASTVWRAFSPGLRPVSWADFLLADVLTSLAKAISDTERAVCLMATGPVMSPPLDACSDASLIIPLGLAAPYGWRLVQCLRVYADTGARPQLANALKYSTAFPVIALSAVKYHVTHEAWQGVFKPLWLLAALINSGFSYFWDVERDWEVGFFSQMRVQGTPLPKPSFASALTFKKPFYLYLMASNAVLRLSWIYKLSPHLRRNHAAVFMIVLAEAFRRFQWLFVRVEVELRKLQAARPELGQLVPPTKGDGILSAAGGRDGAHHHHHHHVHPQGHRQRSERGHAGVPLERKESS